MNTNHLEWPRHGEQSLLSPKHENGVIVDILTMRAAIFGVLNSNKKRFETWYALGLLLLRIGFMHHVDVVPLKPLAVVSRSGGKEVRKDGEVYSGGRWSLRRGIKGSVIETGDSEGRYRADNHAWLVALDRNVVFHAGAYSIYHTKAPLTIQPTNPRHGLLVAC